MDICLTDEKPQDLTEESTEEEKKLHKEWFKANRMAKHVLKTTMSVTVKRSIPEKDLASEYLEAIAEKFKESDKAEVAHLSQTFNSLKYDGSGSVREHIMRLIDIAAKLKELNMPLQDEYVVHHALHSLPNSFSQLKTSYLAQKEKWNLNELIAICVEEEDRMKKEKVVTVNLVGKPKWKTNKLKTTKTITKASATASASASTSKINKPFKFKCYFCKKVGHMNKDCNTYKDWLAKKGKIIPYTVFTLEVDLVDIEPHSWWLDSGSPLHITNSLQGFIRKRVPRSDENHLCVGNRMRVAVNAIGTLKLDLGS